MGVVLTGTALFYGLGLLAMLITYFMPSNKDKGCVTWRHLLALRLARPRAAGHATSDPGSGRRAAPRCVLCAG